jgi:flavin reductase (DIM6/NTAB) family NADH-FMN oxidoreductase RutF
MSRFATGVTVVTTAYEDKLAGLTVSSFSSLSMKPTLVLVCVAQYATSHAIIQQSGRYAVNILSEHQEHLSRCFASPDPQVEKFVPDTYHISEHGLPLLHGVIATLECDVVHSFPGGDHTIFVGEVMQAQVASGRPLLYYRSGYHQFVNM